MIARLSILLPFALSVAENEKLCVHELDAGIYRVRVHPPCQSEVDLADLQITSERSYSEILAKLRPIATPKFSEAVLVNGQRSIATDLLRIDFLKDGFDRTRTEGGWIASDGDPPPELGFEIANRFLQCIRTVTRGSLISVLSPAQTFWELAYLGDDEALVPEDPRLYRRKCGASQHWKAVSLGKAAWDDLDKLTSAYVPHAWHRILLDAVETWPDAAASISLANAALEAFSSWLINHLSSLSGLSTDLWEWINDRGDWYKEPSVEERFDKLLLIFKGVSLKGQPELWRAFKSLRKARNNFAHKGRVAIAENGPELTSTEVASLLRDAQSIIDWCEAQLPDDLRLPPQDCQTVTQVQRDF